MSDLFPECSPAKDWWVQVLLWKDKRVLGLISTAGVGDFGETTRRWSKALKKYITIATHAATNLYSKHMGPIDRADRDMADWGISAKSHYEYDRMVDWLLDANGANDFRIATYYPPDERAAPFKKYTEKMANMRYQFQLDKALAMMSLGVGRDCKDLRGDRPGWMRQAKTWVPCGCGKCIFCLEGRTAGVGHSPVQAGNKRRRSASQSKKDCSKHKAATGTCGLCYTRKRLCLEDKGFGASDIDTAKLQRARNKAILKCKGCATLMCGVCAKAHSIQALEGPG